MTYRQLIRRLAECGCVFDRQAKGSHEIWRNRTNGRRGTVPNHGNTEVPRGTLSQTLRDSGRLGIDKNDFDKI